jgi:serine/threonine protein kinase
MHEGLTLEQFINYGVVTPNWMSLIGKGMQADVMSIWRDSSLVARISKVHVNEDYVNLWPGTELPDGSKIVTLRDIAYIRTNTLTDPDSNIHTIMRREVGEMDRFVVGDNPNNLRIFHDIVYQNIATDDDTRSRLVPFQKIQFIRRSDGSYQVEMIYERMMGTLRDEIRAKQPTIGRCQRVIDMIQVGLALDRLNRKGIFHRDIKPDNLMLDSEGKVRIADFGISIHETSVIEISGTPRYLAPEMLDRNVASSTDQYLLAVTIAEVLIGEDIGKYLTRSEGTNNLTDIPRVLVNVMMNDECFTDEFYEKLEEEWDGYPNIELLKKVLRKATSKNPEDRFVGSEEMVILTALALHNNKVDLDTLIKIHPDLKENSPLKKVNIQSLNSLQEAA